MSVEYQPAAFEAARERIARSLHWAAGSNETLLPAQLARLESHVVGDIDAMRDLRFLVRNAMLVAGLACRLSNVGDNNAPAECVLVVDDLVVLIEIEARAVTLDAVRRVTSGVAIAVSRNRQEIGSVVPVVVVLRLPNSRVDYYRLLDDTDRRLGLAIRTITAALLLMQIAEPETRLTDNLGSLRVGIDRNTLPSDAQELYGVTGAFELGLVPTK
jgi:hypothetical protein